MRPDGEPTVQTSDTFEDEYDKLRNYEDFTTIDWIKDSIIEHNRRLREVQKNQSVLRNERGKLTSRLLVTQAKKILHATEGWVVIALVGACIGANAALISILTEWLANLKSGVCKEGWWLNRASCCTQISDEHGACADWHQWSPEFSASWIIYVCFSILFAYVAAHLVKTFARYAAGSGISEIKCIIAGFVMRGYLGATTLAIKSLTLPLTIASGLSVGKEGPSVHLACCVGNVIARLFSHVSRSHIQMSEIITASSAAGVAVAFGSPIGGVLFSIEEMTSNFNIRTMWRSFVCALVATMTLAAVNPYRTGKLVLFQVTYDRSWSWFEIPFFIIIGIFGGLYGAFVIKFNIQVAAFRRKYLSEHGVMEVVALAGVTALLGYFNLFLRIDMTESLAILFRECEGGGDYENLCQTWAQWRMVNLLLLATIFRVAFIIVSYGSKIPCGIFIPSMAVGATFGRMVGIMVKAMYRANPTSAYFSQCAADTPCITPGTYALLGAAAGLGGVMRITISVVVIMFEVTGALTYVLPLMITLLVTKSVGDYFGSGGIADRMIKFNRFPYLHEKEEDEVHDNVPISLVMKKELVVLQSRGMTARTIENLLDEATVQGFPIVSNDEDRTLLGYIERQELRYVLEKAQRTRGVQPETECQFVPNNPESALPQRRGSNMSVSGYPPPVVTAGAAMGFEEGEVVELIESSARHDSSVLHLWPWVNQTPITVQPQMDLEIVEKLFRTMGPRVILVEQYGSLQGLVTVKDVLRFNAMSEAQGSERLEDDVSIWESGALTAALEDIWLGVQSVWNDIIARITGGRR
ncbi:chloride channel [Auriculariales sp. MPI-PUGE-AT-0066]|nr:chloride channel [Auriculariales sp. MPI-PUGE-AT-0066]